MKKYTKQQIIRNRIILVIAIFLLFILIVWGLSKLANRFINGESGSSSNSLSTSSSGSHSSSQSSLSSSQQSSESQSSQSSSSSSTSSQSSTSSSGTTPTGGKYDESEMPILVNAKNPLPEDYQVQTTLITQNAPYYFASDAVGALRSMLADAYDDGISLWALSAYRSYDSQTRVFNQKLQEYKNQGYSDEQAYQMTAAFIALPGTSEHATGYAVDLNSLDQSFENTKAFEWLINHCAEYGFILRYPKDKEEITGIAYEPWHYRYVGTNHAKIIMENNLCLEEYIAEYGS